MGPPSRPRCSYPILCCTNGLPTSNSVARERWCLQSQNSDEQIGSDFCPAHSSWVTGGKWFHRVVVSRPLYSIKRCKMGGRWQQDWMRWVNDAWVGMCIRREALGDAKDMGRRKKIWPVESIPVPTIWWWMRKRIGDVCEAFGWLNISMNTWLNERIFELLKYFRIFGYREYWTCNLMGQIDVFGAMQGQRETLLGTWNSTRLKIHWRDCRLYILNPSPN